MIHGKLISGKTFFCFDSLKTNLHVLLLLFKYKLAAYDFPSLLIQIFRLMSENKSYHNIFKHIRKVIRIIITASLKKSETDTIKVAEEDAKKENQHM